MGTIRELAELLARTKFRFSDEYGLQDGIEALLKREGVSYQREVRLSPRDRIDFLLGDIGIEVKVDSSEIVVERQLMRYATDPRIGSLILVSSRFRHQSMPQFLNGKPLRSVYLIGSIF